METREEPGARANPGAPVIEPIDVERILALVTERFAHATPEIERIPAGLGDRRFYRVRLAAKTPSGPVDSAGAPVSLIARVEPEAPVQPVKTPYSWLPEPPLEPIRSVLEAAKLPVPRSYGHHPDLRIDLLEDLGSKTLADVPRDDLRARYNEACRLIPLIQGVIGSVDVAPAFGRRFDKELLRTKAAKVIDWSWPGLLRREPSANERMEIEAGFEAIGELLSESPMRLAHRDFMSENLLLAERDGNAEQCVMIDVQGAFMAPPEYDLACLLCDPKVQLPDPLIEELRRSVLEELSGGSDRAEFERRFDAIAVVRLAKDVAHIVHAARSRGDARRWGEIPRGLELLEASLGQLEHSFPELRRFVFVMHALTRGARYSDIPGSAEGS